VRPCDHEEVDGQDLARLAELAEEAVWASEGWLPDDDADAAWAALRSFLATRPADERATIRRAWVHLYRPHRAIVPELVAALPWSAVDRPALQGLVRRLGERTVDGALLVAVDPLVDVLDGDADRTTEPSRLVVDVDRVDAAAAAAVLAEARARTPADEDPPIAPSSPAEQERRDLFEVATLVHQAIVADRWEPLGVLRPVPPPPPGGAGRLAWLADVVVDLDLLARTPAPDGDVLDDALRATADAIGASAAADDDRRTWRALIAMLVLPLEQSLFSPILPPADDPAEVAPAVAEVIDLGRANPGLLRGSFGQHLVEALTEGVGVPAELRDAWQAARRAALAPVPIPPPPTPPGPVRIRLRPGPAEVALRTLADLGPTAPDAASVARVVDALRRALFGEHADTAGARPRWTRLACGRDVGRHPEVHVRRGIGHIEVAAALGETRIDDADVFAEGRWGPIWVAPDASVLVAFGATAERRLHVDLGTGAVGAVPMHRFDDPVGGLAWLVVEARPGGRLLVGTEEAVEVLGPDGATIWRRDDLDLAVGGVRPGPPDLVVVEEGGGSHPLRTRRLALHDGRDVDPGLRMDG
jgi:hypothetical protein